MDHNVKISFGCISCTDRDQEIWSAIKQLQENQMATQQEVDQITSEVQRVATDLGTTRTNLQTEIDNLASVNPQLDLTALRTAVQPLDAAVQALGQLQPLTPSPGPSPEPSSAPTPGTEAAATDPSSPPVDPAAPAA